MKEEKKIEASRTQLCSRLAGQAFLVASGRGDGKEGGPCKSCGGACKVRGDFLIVFVFVFVFVQILPRRTHGKQGVRRGRIGPNVDSDLTGPACCRVARKRHQGLQRCTHKCPYYSPSPRHPQTPIVLSLLFFSALAARCQSAKVSLLGGRVVVVVETNLGFAGQGRLPGGHKGRCSKRSKRVRTRHAEAGCYIRGCGSRRKRCYVAKDQFMHSTSFKIA